MKKNQKIQELNSIQSKIDVLQRDLTSNDLKSHLDIITQNKPDIQNQVVALAQQVRGTELEGLPCTVAVMRGQLLTYEEIASALQLSIKTVKNASKVKGFDGLVNQLTPMIWSDLILDAQACIRHHLVNQRDVNLAKWLLESMNQVMNTSRPVNLHQHNNKTLNIMGNGLPAIEGGDNTPQNLRVEDLAEAMFNRMNQNKSSEPPPITISGT